MNSGGRQWQCQLATSSERLAYLRSTGCLSDLTITFPGHSNIIQSHRWLLAMSSPVFEAMLCGPLAEGDVLSLPEDPPQAFEWMLDHLYRDESQLPSVALATQVYQLASKYQLDTLGHICSQFLISEVNAESFPDVFDVAILLEDKDLLRRCGQVLLADSDDVLRSSRLGVLGRSALQQLLQHKDLTASSEALVFKAILNWGRTRLSSSPEEGVASGEGGREEGAPGAFFRFGSGPSGPQLLQKSVEDCLPEVEAALVETPQIRRREDVASSNVSEAMDEMVITSPSEAKVESDLRSAVMDFLPQVRFLAMSADEFVDHVLPSRVLSSEEAVAVLLNMKGAADVPLPGVASCKVKEGRSQLRRSSVLFCQHHCTRHNQEVLSDFRTSRSILVTRVIAPAVVTDRESVVQVISPTSVDGGVWRGVSCTFERPVRLAAGTSYSVVVQLAYGPCAGCQCSIVSEHQGVLFSGKTLAACPVFIQYREAP